MPNAMSPKELENARRSADRLMKKVEEICNAGALPGCYGGKVEEYLCDFWPDLPWNNSALESVKHILANHGPTLDRFQSTFHFNLREEVEKGLTEFA